MDGTRENSVSSDALKQLSSAFKSDSLKKFFGFTDLKLCSLEEKKYHVWFSRLECVKFKSYENDGLLLV